MYGDWYGVCDFVVFSVVEVCADYGGVNVFHVCLCLLCSGCVGCCDFCLICDVCSGRCSFMGSVCVSSCRCVILSAVHPVAIFC